MLGARDGHHRVHDVVGVVAVEEAPGVPKFVLQCPLDVVRPHPELLRDTHVEQDDALDRVAVLERDVGGARHVGLVRVATKAYGIYRHVAIRVRDARVYLLRARVIRHYHQSRGCKQGCYQEFRCSEYRPGRRCYRQRYCLLCQLFSPAFVNLYPAPPDLGLLRSLSNPFILSCSAITEPWLVGRRSRPPRSWRSSPVAECM